MFIEPAFPELESSRPEFWEEAQRAQTVLSKLSETKLHQQVGALLGRGSRDAGNSEWHTRSHSCSTASTSARAACCASRVDPGNLYLFHCMHVLPSSTGNINSIGKAVSTILVLESFKR